jgi:hypothetical protein
MTTTIDAKTIVKTEVTPHKDGERVGAYIVKAKLDLSTLVIDVRDLAPEDLVPSFVNAMLHHLEATTFPIEKVTSLLWMTKFPSEEERLNESVELYLEDWRKRHKS